jgi:D-alanine-D-alanine ligase
LTLIPHDEHDADYSKYTAAMESHYPLFAKLNARGGSVGISSYNKIENPSQLNSTIERLKVRYPNDDILVETYLAGREFTVGILGTGKAARVIGVLELKWSQCPTGEETQVVDFGTQYAKESLSSGGNEHIETPGINDPKATLASKVALDAYRVLRCRDAGRIDVRFGSGDRENVAHVIDVSWTCVQKVMLVDIHFWAGWYTPSHSS